MKKTISNIKEEIKKCDNAINHVEKQKQEYIEMLEEIRSFKLKTFENR